MKRIILLALLGLPLTTLAQQPAPTPDDHQTDLLGKGTVGVSLNGAGGYGSYRGTVYRFTPRVSYFLRDGWSVSLEGRHENYSRVHRYNGLGVSTRYYFVRDRRLALFLQGGITAGQTKANFFVRDAVTGNYTGEYRYNTPTVQGNLGVGAHYRLSSRWAIEGNLEGTLRGCLMFHENRESVL